MNPIHSRGAVLVFTLGYILASGMYLISTGNGEFTRYLALLAAILAAFVVFRERITLPAWLLWLISLVGLAHLLGGIVRIGEDVLYAYVPLYIGYAPELTIIKYDQLVHFFASGVGALVVFAFLRKAREIGPYALPLITFLAAYGIGSVNEIVEFWVTLTVPEHGVGGYYNNALDLVFNALGALFATLVALLWWGREEE